MGSFPTGASPHGALDMAGSVREWVADWYGASYYRSSPGRNPTGPERGARRVHRGGSWNDPSEYAASAYRGFVNPGVRDPRLGFRCVVD